MNDPELKPEDEPDTSGTLFLTMIMLTMIFGFWIMMFFEMLDR